MASRQGPQLPPIITDELRDTGWRIASGSKHWKIMIGENLVAVWPRGVVADVNRRATLMTRSNIRRWKRAHQ